MAEDPFDRLLRRTLQGDTPDAGCPEPSVLAAFADGLLEPAERSALEAHAASCARCSAELALIAATALEPVPATAAAGGRRLHWRWAVLLVTAVLVFVVWTETDRREQVEQLRQETSAPAAPPAEAPAAGAIDRSGDLDERPAPELQKGDAIAPEPKKEGAPPRAVAARSKSAPPSPQDAEEQRQVQPADARSQRGPSFRDEVRLPAESQDRVAAQASPPSQTAAPELRRSEPAAGARLAGAAQEEREAASRRERIGEADGKDAPDSAAAPPQPAAPAAEAVPVDAPKRVDRTTAATGNLAAVFRSGPLVISPSSNPDVRVRVVDAGIERTQDGGGTWTLERSRPVHTVLTGVCPSAEICWLGGNAGLVLRREPSGRWLDVSLGDAAAVSRLDAADADRATATLADGRRFSTADGGRSWRPLP
jgi:hypothetical protein